MVPEQTAPDCLTLVIEREERQAALREALQSMSALEQQVLLRRVCADHPFAAIARGLGLGQRDVRTLFDSAYSHLEAVEHEAGEAFRARPGVARDAPPVCRRSVPARPFDPGVFVSATESPRSIA
jgi:hypothetical protein